MTSTRIRVGDIGANPDRSWAAQSHIPALKALPQYDLVAVSTSRAETARRAAHQFGVRLAFGDYQALIDCPEVDLVVVSVNVSTHFELASAAIRGGKHVMQEIGV